MRKLESKFSGLLSRSRKIIVKSLISLFIGLILLVNLQCSKEQALDKIDGVYVERIAPENLTPNCYSIDNTVYTLGKKFLFEYELFDKNGLPKRVFGYGTELYDTDKDCPKCIKYVTIEPLDEQALKPDFMKNSQGYNQTPYEQNYIFNNSEYHLNPASTGVKENGKNIWLHPWRKDGFFSLLQLNPYPYIMKPYEIGNKWSWTLGGIGGEKYMRWLPEGVDSIDSEQYYEIVDQEMIETKFGILKCWKTESVAQNGYQETKLISYFNEEFGFVRFEYENINGSKINIFLSEIKNETQRFNS